MASAILTLNEEQDLFIRKCKYLMNMHNKQEVVFFFIEVLRNNKGQFFSEFLKKKEEEDIKIKEEIKQMEEVKQMNNKLQSFEEFIDEEQVK